MYAMTSDGTQTMRGESTTTTARRPSPNTKACPRCGAVLFEDMDVCFGCLYDFSTARGEPSPGSDRPWDDGPRADWVDDEMSSLFADEAFSPPDDDDRWQEVEQPPARDVRSADGAVESSSSTTQPLSVAAKAAKASFPAHLSENGMRSALRICGDALTVSCPLPEAGLSIGRDPDNDVILAARTVSRHHVRVFASDRGGATVEDQGATNPALIDGVPVRGKATLPLGSTLDICGTTCVLVASDQRG